MLSFYVIGGVIIKKNKLLEMKSNPSIISYLGFLQANIGRMGTNSSNIKALIAVVITILSTILLTNNSANRFWWCGIVIATIGMIMDAYYLALERMYRKKYNKIYKEMNTGNIDEKEIYNMNPKNTELKYEIVAEMIESIKSFSIYAYYALFFTITILLKLI